MQLADRKSLILAAATFVAGLLIGWLVIGWWLWPVQYYDADPYDLRERHKISYIMMVADSYAVTGDLNAARQRLEGFSPDELTRILTKLTTDYMQQARGTEAQRVTRLATDLGVIMPLAPVVTPAPPKTEEGKSVWNTIFAICGALVAVAVLFAGAAVLWSQWQKRKGGQFSRPPTAPAIDLDVGRPTEAVSPSSLGTFVTTYNIGDDSYDDCFPIETPSGEFLGECGVGISEVIGDGEPSLVTAFEIWLFDKSDIRTVTKVLMSAHAFADDELRERLAPKGEAVLAEPGKLISLDTASLHVDARIKEMAYGAGEGPENSHFARLTVEMTVSSRVGDRRGEADF